MTQKLYNVLSSEGERLACKVEKKEAMMCRRSPDYPYHAPEQPLPAIATALKFSLYVEELALIGDTRWISSKAYL